MEYQLRQFQITQGNLDAFVAAWTSGVVPLREKFGFHVHGAWLAPESSEFIWILGYDGPGTFAAADVKYYNSAERRSLSPDPAAYILESVERTVVRVRGLVGDS